MNTTDEHLAPQLMDTSLKEEEEEKIEQVVAVRWDEVMTDEDTVIFAGQTPSIVEQYLRYAQGTTEQMSAGRGAEQEEEEEEEGRSYAGVQDETVQNRDRYARELAKELRDDIWDEFVETLEDQRALADESNLKLQAAVAAAKDSLLRQAYDNVLAMLKSGS
jgi:hypothetical protein